MSNLLRRRAHGSPQAAVDLDERLRRTLHTVAAAMPDTATAPAPTRARSRVRRRVVLAVAALAVPLTAAGYVFGPEHVDQIPPKHVLLTGDADGERYWMIPGRSRDDCGYPVSDVELVVEDWNIVGREWSTVGLSYGDQIQEWIGTPSPLQGGGRAGRVKTCGTDKTAWLADPARFEYGYTKIDDDRIYLVGVHPTVRSIRITTPAGSNTIPTVPTPDLLAGPRYTAFDVPDNSPHIIVNLLDASGQPIPNGERDLTKPRTGP